MIALTWSATGILGKQLIDAPASNLGLVWSQDQIYTYVDDPLQQVLLVDFISDKTMWETGHFAGDTVNSSLVLDPWSQTGRPNTPFDQEFYLILNVAVGGTNGYFPDGEGGKPWTDAGDSAYDFYQSKWTEKRRSLICD